MTSETETNIVADFWNLYINGTEEQKTQRLDLIANRFKFLIEPYSEKNKIDPEHMRVAVRCLLQHYFDDLIGVLIDGKIKIQ